MLDSLNRIKTWLALHSPPTLAHLNGPAAERDLIAVESATGLQLPDCLRNFLRLHNGEDGETWHALLGNGHQLLPCSAIIRQYRLDQKLGLNCHDPAHESPARWKLQLADRIIAIDGPVKPLMLHPRWLPLTCMNGDVFRYLDFDPAPGGRAGQVIEVDPECCSYRVLAPSFGALIIRHATELAAGAYVVDDEGYLESAIDEDQNWDMPAWLQTA